MKITRVPLRVSLFGGGSDLPEFYQHTPGQVLSFSINKYIYIASHPEFHGHYRMAYSKIENVNQVNEINHPLLRNSLDFLGIDFGIEIGSFADIPSKGSGLGSSSAFTVGLIDNLNKYKGHSFSQMEIAASAYKIEREIVGDPVGKQDHYGTAIGGLKHITFNSDETVKLDNIELHESNFITLQNQCKLVYTGITRDAKSILIRNAQYLLSQPEYVARNKELIELIPAGISAILKNDMNELSNLLNEAWRIKNYNNSASGVDQIDKIYIEMKNNGILGAKLLGAGGGGFFLGIGDSSAWSLYASNYPTRKIIDLEIDKMGVTTYEI